jgi:hypothetical protein
MDIVIMKYHYTCRVVLVEDEGTRITRGTGLVNWGVVDGCCDMLTVDWWGVWYTGLEGNDGLVGGYNGLEGNDGLVGG